MVNGYKELFVKYYFDENRICLYQVSADGSSDKTPDEESWVKLTEKGPDDAICIPRDLAERVEEQWDERREPINNALLN